MAKIQLNGKKILLGPKMTIYNLIKKYKLDKKKVAVEINGKIALKQNYEIRKKLKK